jgi:hypothetical protein
MLKRNGFIGSEQLMLHLCCPPSGEMALMAWEAELKSLLDHKIDKSLDALEAELEKRGLDASVKG